jgi:hypothetical protein
LTGWKVRLKYLLPAVGVVVLSQFVGGRKVLEGNTGRVTVDRVEG